MLEKLRSGEPLTAKEKLIHDQGLVTVLRQIHDELDAAVLEAYGWSDLWSRDIPVANKEAPHSCGAGECVAIEKREALPNDVPFASRQECRDSLLTRLVALNHERAAEEKRGLIRWLRPDYQNPTAAASQPVQTTLAGTEVPSPKSKIKNQKSKINNQQSTINNQQSTIINHQSKIPRRLSSGPTASPTKSPSFASSLAPATRVSPLLMMPNRSLRSSAERTKNASSKSKGFWKR